MTGTNCDLFKHKSSRSYLNHLVHLAKQTLQHLPSLGPVTEWLKRHKFYFNRVIICIPLPSNVQIIKLKKIVHEACD
jgi:hypothetical protein